MKKAGFPVFFTLLFLIVIWSCDPNRVYENYQPVNENGWNKDSLVTFTIPVNDTIQQNNLYINVRNNLDYKYQNLWLFIQIEQPKGVLLKDTFEILLAAPTGKWLGEGFGGLKEIQTTYRKNVYFPVSGNYTISIQQAMRDQNLSGIKDIGFRVEKMN